MAERARRAAIYARVSTDGQSVENQLRELEVVAERHGWEVAATYTDEGVSGAKGRDGRPGFDALCGAVARREVDVVAAWSVDRLGRSLQDLVAFLGELRAKGVDLYLHVQGLDTSTPAGRAMFQMLGVFSEFERAMIQERVRAGLARARASGKRLGRPPALTPRQRRGLRRDRGEGMSLRALARKYGTTAPTVRRVLATDGGGPVAAGGRVMETC
jgi:DNA invertase Pin-like site-specific DNA recombinase